MKFRYHFKQKPKTEVIEVLEKYQNEDGGFGTLDYDFIYHTPCLKQPRVHADTILPLISRTRIP